MEILENAVPFANGSCRKFKADVLVNFTIEQLLSLGGCDLSSTSKSTLCDLILTFIIRAYFTVTDDMFQV